MDPAPKHYAVAEQPPPADTSHIQRKYLNIPYAHQSAAQKLDIYLPDQGVELFPVIVAIHGGAFMGCDKGDMQVLPMLEGLKRGYAVISINYRMSGEAQFPALVQDAKAAVRWIRGNASLYGFDPQRIAAWGGSAGGYLAAMLGVSAGAPELEDLSLGHPEQPSHVQAVVDWFGPTHFLLMDEQLADSGMLPPPGFRHSEPNSPESLLLGGIITEIPERVKAASHETYIGEEAPPFLIQHGDKDATVPVQQSVGFARKLQEKFGAERIILEIIPDAEHADVKFETAGNVARVLDFLDHWLKSGH